MFWQAKLYWINSKTLMNPSKFNFKLNVDGREETGNTSMLLIANGPNIGGGRVPLTDLSLKMEKLIRLYSMIKVLVF